jgi:hypothetical protein
VTDWNLATDTGFYRSSSGADNAPGAQFYVGMTLRYSADYMLQQVFQRGGGIAWQRAMVAGAWGSWVRVYNTEADLDTRYALTQDFAYKKIADVTIANGATSVDIATGGNRFLRFLVGRVQPLTDGVQLRLQFSTDGGSTWANVTQSEAYLKDMALAPATPTAVSDTTNLLTGGAAVGVAGSGTGAGWFGEIRIDNANQARPLVGSFDGIWKNGAVINRIFGGFFDTGTTNRTHYRLKWGSGNFEGGRIVVMGVP